MSAQDLWENPEHTLTLAESELLFMRQDYLSLYNAAYARGEATERYKAILARIDQVLPPALRGSRP
jgi:hypothetical protein